MADEAKAARITAFYEQYNPENVKNIPEILRVFAGREDVLCAKLLKKYGCQPDLQSLVINVPEPQHAYVPGYEPFVAPPSTPCDHRSATFDAAAALREHERLPHTQPVHPLDNLNKCRALLPPTDPHYNASVGQTKPKPAMPAAAKVAPPPALLDTIGDQFEAGPLSVLRACLKAKAKVCVVIRRVNSIRGTCTGFLKGFDKHMNVVLIDVTERYVPLLRAPEHPSVPPSLAQWHRTDGVQKRFLRQLLIRGDNVVLVYPTKPLPSSAG
ncbi:hypothetical protein SPRG_06491 [Saprolegnia parasitica CBS 223.65]|uniref:Sm domain-containing protein n=1 Tax=Saprolegnia parasitica (strain CBS 223.65) TaxID=695850 RepID=A0A067CQ40_SAPPC|nr:hypothetical protein SPRG_06491 [Saprolegnia parasitica CBS 223.65]KDO28636.1 hypothetical protein SPRG_06491 [Saprolegnia parasitica CBS 223.65]|eukprot:XP_012200698.1 hypothetical protein SPRG_06491 [Saprolegnia parasitica CBS 223.65]